MMIGGSWHTTTDWTSRNNSSPRTDLLRSSSDAFQRYFSSSWLCSGLVLWGDGCVKKWPVWFIYYQNVIVWAYFAQFLYRMILWSSINWKKRRGAKKLWSSTNLKQQEQQQPEYLTLAQNVSHCTDGLLCTRGWTPLFGKIKHFSIHHQSPLIILCDILAKG